MYKKGLEEKKEDGISLAFPFLIKRSQK